MKLRITFPQYIVIFIIVFIVVIAACALGLVADRLDSNGITEGIAAAERLQLQKMNAYFAYSLGDSPTEEPIEIALEELFLDNLPARDAWSTISEYDNAIYSALEIALKNNADYFYTSDSLGLNKSDFAAILIGAEEIKNVTVGQLEEHIYYFRLIR